MLHSWIEPPISSLDMPDFASPFSFLKQEQPMHKTSILSDRYSISVKQPIVLASVTNNSPMKPNKFDQFNFLSDSDISSNSENSSVSDDGGRPANIPVGVASLLPKDFLEKIKEHNEMAKKYDFQGMSHVTYNEFKTFLQ